MLVEPLLQHLRWVLGVGCRGARCGDLMGEQMKGEQVKGEQVKGFVLEQVCGVECVPATGRECMCGHTD